MIRVGSLHVVVHTISESIALGTHALALWLLGTSHWVDWLEIALETRTISRRNVGNGVGVVGKAAEGSRVCMIIERINWRGVVKHMGRIDVRWSRWTAARLLLGWQFRLSVFFAQ